MCICIIPVFYISSTPFEPILAQLKTRGIGERDVGCCRRRTHNKCTTTTGDSSHQTSS